MIVLFTISHKAQSLSQVWEKGLKKCATSDQSFMGNFFRRYIIIDPTQSNLLGQMYKLNPVLNGGGLSRDYRVDDYKTFTGEPTIIKSASIDCDYDRNVGFSVSVKPALEILELPVEGDVKVGSVQKTDLVAKFHWETLDDRIFLDSLEKIPENDKVRLSLQNKDVYMVVRLLKLESLKATIVYKPDDVISGKVSIPNVITAITSANVEAKVEKKGDNSLVITTQPGTYFVAQLASIKEKFNKKQQRTIFNYRKFVNKGNIRYGISL